MIFSASDNNTLNLHLYFENSIIPLRRLTRGYSFGLPRPAIFFCVISIFLLTYPNRWFITCKAVDSCIIHVEIFSDQVTGVLCDKKSYCRQWTVKCCKILQSAVKIDIGCLHFSAEVVLADYHIPSDQRLKLKNTSMKFKQGQIWTLDLSIAGFFIIDLKI